MLKDTFLLDGVDAASVGIRLQGPIQFSAAKPVVDIIEIPGRNGTLSINTGAYANRSGKARCFALDKNVVAAVDAATAFLLSGASYRRLECSNDPDHFWMARVTNGARIENRLGLLNPFEIEFDCMPQRFEKSGETPVSFAAPGTLTNAFSGAAKPLITISGNGAGSITVGGVTVKIVDMADTLILDADAGTVTDASGLNQSSKISAPELPTLHPGDNVVGFSGGVTSIEIKPRWWSK